MTSNSSATPSGPTTTPANPIEKLEALLQDQALRNAQRRKDTSTLQQFGQSQANEEGGRWAKPTQVVGANAAPEYPRQPEGSFSNQAAVVPPEESLGFSVEETPIVGEDWEVQQSLERLERLQGASVSHDAECERGAGATAQSAASFDVETAPPTQSPAKRRKPTP
jgi:hypothetical protein